MGMRMRKKWDLPSEQTGALAVLGIAFLLGGGAGCLFAAMSDGAGAQELSSYLTGYLTLAQSGELPRGLWTLLWEQFKVLLAALVLSVTSLGVVGLPLLIGVKGFSLAFPVACFCRIFGSRGLFPAFILFGLPALLWTPAIFLLGTSGLLSSYRLLRRSLGEGGGFPLSGFCWYRAGVCVGLGLAAGLLEHWVVPVLLRAAARFVL